MAYLLLMRGGNDWLPILGVMIFPMAVYLAIEWLVEYTEQNYRRHHNAHK